MYNKKYLKKCMAVILSASMVMPTSIASMASEPATEVTTEAAVEETEIAQTEAATEADTEAAAETEAVETEQTGKETEPATETVTESTAVQESAAEEAAVLSDDWDDEYSVDFKMLYFDSDGSDLWSEEHIVKDSFSWTFNPYVPVKEGYTFKGWATKKGSSTVVYKAGDKITVTEADEYEKIVRLYAVWEKQGTTYKVTYYNEDGSQELKTDSKVSTADSCSFSAYSGAAKKEGYEFIGWSTKPNATAIDYNTTKGPVLKSTSPELKLYAVYVKMVQNEPVKVNVYVEYLDESLEKGYEVDEASKQEVSVTCKTASAHKEAGYTHQLKYKDIADAAGVSSIKVRDGYEIVGMTKNAGTNQVYYGLDNTSMIGGMMQNGSFYLVAKKKPGTTYKVTYYNEDGTQELKTDSKTSTADSCSFSAYAGAAKKEGYEFIGWSTKPNATAIDYNTTKGPVLKSTSPELKLYAVYVKMVQNEPVKVNVYVEYLDESLEKGYEVDEASKQEVSVTCKTASAHKEAGYTHQLKYKDIADAAGVSSIKVRDGYEIVGMTKNAGTNQVYYGLDNTSMIGGMMQNGSFYLVAKKKPGTTYKVTYYNEDGTQELKTDSKTSTADSCSFSAYAGAAKKEGYEFIGWSKTPNATAIDYNTTKGPSLKSTAPELKLYAVYVKTVQNEDVNLNVYVEYLDESLEKGYEVDEASRKEVTVTCETTYAHKESGSVHQLKYKTIADAAGVSSFKVRDGYEIVGMTKNEGANEVVFALDNTFMTSGMMQNGSFYLVARKTKQPETEPGTEESESESEKQPETESEKQPESETEKQTESETEKQPESETEKQPETETEKQPETETEKKQETEKQPESETEKKQETEKQPETEAPSKPSATTTSAAVMRLRGSASSTRVRLAWTRIKGAEGYEIYGANCKVSTKAPLVKTVKNGSTYVTAISGLKKASSYRYYVKAYKMVNGKKTYLNQSNAIYIATAGGTRTNAKAVTAASTSITLKKGQTKNLRATVVSVNSKKKLFYRSTNLTYTTTDKKIATVTSRGTVAAKAKGSCYIYVSAANGVYTKVKVTVK